MLGPLLMMGASGAGGGPSLADAILDLNPVGYWKLDETSGTTATDSSGNARHGTYTGSGYTLAGAAGPDGADYADFGNGASSHVAIADNNVFTIPESDGLTVFMLLKPDNVNPGTRRMPITKGASGNYEWGTDCFVNQGLSPVSGALMATVWSTTGGRRNAGLASGVMTTDWQAVAFEFRRGTTENATLWRNGAEIIGTGIGSSTSAAYANGTAEVRIGWRADNANPGWWEGGIAHVAIFDTQLSDSQIESMMDAADAEGWY